MMIGAAGAAVTGSPEMTAFVNTAEMRAHPRGEEIGRRLVASLAGWNMFMPHDLVHPLRETNWVLMSGSLFLGSTQKNVILASHTLDEKRADGVFSQLEKRLPGKASPQGRWRESARGDGRWRRAGLRQSEGGRPRDSSEGRGQACRGAPTSCRRLAGAAQGRARRIAFARVPRALSRFGPIRIGPSRFWIEAEAAALTLNGEADCKDDEEASRTAKQIRAALDDVRGIEALAARSLTRDASVWPDGKVVRYRAELDDRSSRSARWPSAVGTRRAGSLRRCAW